MPTPRNIQGTLRADYLAYFRVYIFWLSTMPRRRADKHSRLLKTRIGWGFSVLRGRRPNYWIRSLQKLSLLFRKLRLEPLSASETGQGFGGGEDFLRVRKECFFDGGSVG